MIIFSRRLQSNYSLSLALSLALLCYLQTIQAINALTSPSDRHNYKKTEQCNSSIQDGLFEHSVTLLSYPSPCLRGNFSPQKNGTKRGAGTLLPGPESPSDTCRKTHFQAGVQGCLPAGGSGTGAQAPIWRIRSTQHAPEPNFQNLNSCSPSQSPGIP